MTKKQEKVDKAKKEATKKETAKQGIDSTISSGWLDLKVKNETNNIYQIDIYFDEEYMYGKILSNKESDVAYVISNENLRYVRQNNKIYEIVDIVRAEIDKNTNMQIKKEKLYSEKVEITYELSKDIKIEER